MTEKNIYLQPGTEKLIISEGKELEQKQPERILITGDIHTVENYLAKRWAMDDKSSDGEGNQHVGPDKAIVIVNEDASTIEMRLDPQNFFGTVLTGRLVESEELGRFGINTEKVYNRETLVEVLKFSARFFTDRLKFTTLLAAIQKMELSTQGNIKNDSDTRGNKDMQFKKQVSSDNIPQFFVLELPIFKGEPVEKFQVELCIEVTEHKVIFWLESPDLEELIYVRRKDIFAQVLEHCKDFVIIYQ